MNCTGGYAEKEYSGIGEKESIMLALEFQGICIRGNYSLFPVQVGDFDLYTIKFRTATARPMYDSFDRAVEEFIKLTEE